MRKVTLATVLVAAAGAAPAQTQNSTTNCNVWGNTVNCNTTTQTSPGFDWGAFYRQQQEINRQNQENITRSFDNLGTAIAQDREQRKQRRVQQAIDLALAKEVPAPPPPADELPVLLACVTDQGPLSIALYERNARADVTAAGTTRTRLATFTPDAVTWTSPLMTVFLSRVDLSILGIAAIPELQGYSNKGTCQIAQRQL